MLTDLGRYADALELDSNRQAAVQRRLAAAEELARKHRVPLGELHLLRATLETELAGLESAEQDVATLKRDQGEALAAYRDSASKLSEARKAAASTFSVRTPRDGGESMTT